MLLPASAPASAVAGGAGSSMVGFRAQQAKLVAPDTRSFAVRSGVDALAARIRGITKVSQFLELAREHPELIVEMNVTGHTPVYIASTTLDADKLAPCAKRFLWAYMNNQLPATVGVRSTWVPVSHTVPMFVCTGTHKNILWVTPAASMTGVKSQCCFPAFLDTSVQRVCGPAFEGLNKTTQVVVPPAPHVVGFGTSATKVDKTGDVLYSPVTLRINSTQVTLTHL